MWNKSFFHPRFRLIRFSNNNFLITDYVIDISSEHDVFSLLADQIVCYILEDILQG